MPAEVLDRTATTATDAGLAARFFAHAARRPQRPAVIGAGGAVTYGALAASVRRRAAALGADRPWQGAPAGERRVALDADEPLAFTAAFLACAAAGVTAVVLDPRWSEGERTAALAATRPRPIADVEAAGVDIGEPAPIPPAVTAATPLFIGFTSGTTGRPKAYLRRHGSWTACLDHAAREFPVDPDDDVLIPGSPAHSLVLYALVETLSAGATARLAGDFDADQVLATLAAAPVTRIHLVPTMAAALITAAERLRLVVPSVRTVICAGAKLPEAARQGLGALFPAAAVVEYYGASELGFVTVARPDEGWPVASVGRPFDGVRLRLRDDDGGEAAVGRIGVVEVRSDMLCAGYLDGGDGSGFRLQDGWATVGDRGWRDERGALYLAGREGGMIVTGGLNVYPAEVETVLLELPDIAEAAVVGVADAYWGERVVAVVRWRDERGLSRDAVVAHCRGRLARHKCPRQVFAVAAMPTTAAGKIDAGRLRAWLAATAAGHEVT